MTTTSSVPTSNVPWPEAAQDQQTAPAAQGEPLFPPTEPPPGGATGPRSLPDRLRTLPARAWRGRPDDPAWARPALLGLLAATAVLHLWNLSVSGWANSFYSAAVQAGSQSWKAFFYGSSDAASFITVDKPPMSLWPMELSARVFGLSSWSVLAPEALMGVATVGVVYATVRRRFSALGGLVAGAVLALTPVAALMFRFNNPDALLVLLMTTAAYALVRATETASTRWVVLTGALFGLGFLTKTLQAFLILPAFAVIYLVVAPTGLWRRVRQVLAAGLALLVAGGWWVAIVQLVPAADRPYIGGSQDNSFLSLTFGYNGFGRLTGNETGSVGGGGARAGASAAGRAADTVAGGFGAPGGLGGLGGRGAGGGGWGSTGITRLFGTDIGGQIAWLLPAALLLLLLGLWATRRYDRTDSARTAFLVWGGWLLCTGLTFSYMSGIFHQYYTVALAPAVAALVGMGVDGLWRARRRLPYAAVLAVVVVVTTLWAYVLLGRASGFVPWLRWAVLVGGIVAGATLLLAGRLTARVAAVVGVAALATSLGGPTAYALDTVATAHTGSLPTAGPRVASGGPGGGFPGAGAAGGGRALGQGGRGGFPGGFPGGGLPAGGMGGGGIPGGGNGFGGGGLPGGAGTGTGTGGLPGGGMGGLINGAQVSAELAGLLEQNASSSTWAAATVGAQNAASYQLATGKPVMALGGFNGTDPSLSLQAFERYVRDGRIHYFIASGGFGGGGGGGGRGGSSSDSSEISTWVTSHFTAETVGSATVYDLTAPSGN